MPRAVLRDEVLCEAAVECVERGGRVRKIAGDFFLRERFASVDEGEQFPLQCRGEEVVLFRRIFSCHRADFIRFLREFQRRQTVDAPFCHGQLCFAGLCGMLKTGVTFAGLAVVAALLVPGIPGRAF